MTKWTEGVCEDGAAILRDGEMIPITELLEILNRTDAWELALYRILGHSNITGERARDIAAEALGKEKPTWAKRP